MARATLFVALCLSVMLTVGRATAQSTEDAIVARVNGEAILLSQLKEAAFDQEIPLAEISSSSLMSAGYRRALTQVVDELLLVQKAQSEEIKISDMDLARQVDDMIGNLRAKLGTQADLDRFLTEHHLTLDQLKRVLSDRERRRTLSTQVVAKRVSTDAGAVERFKQERAQQGRSSEEAHLAQILVLCSPTERETATGKERYKRALKIAEEAAANPAGFIECARKYSDDAESRASGGDLGWVEPVSLVAPLRDQVAKMKPGDISPPVTTDQGYHILFMVGRHTAADMQYIAEFEKQRAKLVEQLRQEASIQLFDLQGKPLPDKPLTPAQSTDKPQAGQQSNAQANQQATRGGK